MDQLIAFVALLSTLVQLLGTMSGVAALIAIVINLLKWAKIVGDGDAQGWSFVLNLVALAALVFLHFVPVVTYAQLDQTAAALAQLLTLLLSLIVQLGVSQFTHDRVRGLRVIGKSYSV